MPNHLADAISPYLLQHRDNPVNWYPWGDEAFALAKQKNIPIFLSVGYAACHWCHVMAHESFEDAEVAKLLNDHFIAIKVDREERPDIDKLYLDALMAMQGHGGWPLSMFLTADGKPFFGGTYFPKEDIQGRPGFITVLKHVLATWEHYPKRVTEFSDDLTFAMQSLNIESTVNTAENISFATITSYAQEWKSRFDKVLGGLSGAPKFPQVSFWRYIFTSGIFLKDTTLLEAAHRTAKNICSGGIYDHVGGGFMRYSVDEQWIVPHFEKMLYDNAQLILWLSELYAYQKNPLFEYCVSRTVEWLQREMRTESGAFAASLDADSEGEEGKYYVWSEAEIDAVLGSKARAFKKAFFVTADGNWEHHSILYSNDSLKFSKELAKLLNAREQRIAPARDDKVLADWNGLLIQALVKASETFDRADWLLLAEEVFATICQKLYHEQQLFHCYRAKQYTQIAFVEDYANMIAAAIALYAATGKMDYLQYATQFTEELDHHYWSEEHHAFYQCSKQAPALIAKAISGQDQALPSGNGMMAENLIKLWHLTHKESYHDKAIQLINAFYEKLNNKTAAFFGYLARAQGLLEQGFVIKVSRENMKILRECSLPPLSFIVCVDDMDGVEICYQQQCYPPMTTAEEVVEFLKSWDVEVR